MSGKPTLAALLLALCVAAGAAPPAFADTGLPLPRFVSLRSGEVNVRAGPGTRYPIAWMFVRSGLPLQVIAEFDVWRKIRDIDGAEGWVHQSLLSGERTAVITGAVRTLLNTPEPLGVPVVSAEPGVIAKLLECKGTWCRLQLGKLKGWLPRDEFWGTFPDETVK